MTPRVAALLFVVLAACSSPGDRVVDLEGVGRATELTPAVYEAELSRAGATIASALDTVARAGSLEAVEVGLVQLGRTVSSEIDRLAVLRPPRGARLLNLELVRDLRGFEQELPLVFQEVITRELCAGPSVMARISQLDSVAGLRAREPFSASLPDARELPDRRLANGEIVLDQRGSGSNQFSIANSGERAAVVTLAGGGLAVLSVHVDAGQRTTVDRITPGVYTVYYTTGVDWDPRLRTFTRSCAFLRIEEPFELTPAQSQGVELGMPDAALTITEVDPEDLPSELVP